MYRSRLFVAAVATFAAVLAFGGLLALGVFTGDGSATGASAQQPHADDGTIAVTGEGQVTQTPDAASAVVGVELTGDNLDTVLADANQRMDAVIASLTAQNIPEEEIQTQTFSIRVERDHQADGRPIIGYTVVNMVRVTVTPLEQIADVVDEAVSAGANQVGNITFTVQDRDVAIRQAREQAVENAREKAEHYAQIVGVSLGTVVSISEAAADAPLAEPIAEEIAADDTAPPIQPGQQTINVRVDVVYSIE